MLRVWDNGFVAFDTKQELMLKDDCRVDKPVETKLRSLTLNDLSPAFFILGAGFLLSTFCFVIEILSKYVLIWATGRVYNMDTEKSLQPSCESRPGRDHVETSAPAPTTAYALKCEELEEEIGDGVEHLIGVPVAGTDGMQGKGVHWDTGNVETSATADTKEFIPQCEALGEKTGDGVVQWILMPVDGTDGMQGEGIHPKPVSVNFYWLFF